MSNHYDVIVIGAGPGGLACATKLAGYGKKVVLVEKADIGGTCLNRGCVPTKTLMHTADLYRTLKEDTECGLCIEGVSIDYASLKNKKEEVVSKLKDASSKGLKALKVTVLNGEATVIEPGKVVVKTENEDVELTSDAIVIATGSLPAIPPIEGVDIPTVITSDEILSQVPSFDELIIIGGGVIGMEFASLYNSLGTKVTVLEGLPRILSTMDKEISSSLSLSLKKKGVTIVTDALVSKINQEQGKTTCTYTAKNKTETISAQAVLLAVGRKVNLNSVLNPLPELDRGRAIVDDNMMSSIPGIYVIGDAAAGYPQLAHAASAQGEKVAAVLAGIPYTTDLHLVPGCVYTQPEIASVGMSEQEAKDKGLNVHVGKVPTTGNAKSVLSGDERGFIKVIADETGTLLGAQLFCSRATDMVGEFAVAIGNKLNEKQVASIIRPHPTYEESIKDALEASIKKNK
ncbi:MAG: dihydrolipoyl dehydrogenase [Holdemanella sp.]|nr:dihydrolipoyl dehydrogenase [Holdemanella sp.]